MIPDALVDEVRARADIVEVVGEQVSLKRSGKDFKALCPFHNEKNPSFYVVPAKGIYKCFSCGESGDVFTFLMKRHGLDFPEAVRQLAARVGVEIPDTSHERPHDDPDRALYEAVAFAEDFFRSNLWEGEAGERARRYVEQRGLERATAERFLLGYAPDGWRNLRERAHKHGIEDDILLAAGLIKESDRGEEPYDRFRDRLIFPIADVGGRVVAFGGRLLRPAENAAKYLNSPDGPIFHKGSVLYGLNWSKSAIRRDGSALVVEGYMDYLALAAAGIENVVAGMGTALTSEQANLVARYTARAFLLYDSDPAGMKATFRTADALLRAGVHPLVVSLPDGEDPDSLVRRGGKAALAPLLDGAQDVLERKLNMLEERGHFSDIEGSRRALDRLLPTLRAVIDPALRDIYLARVAERTGVRRETLEAEMAAEVPIYGSAAAARGARERWRAGGGRRIKGARDGDLGHGAVPAAPKAPAQEKLLLVLMLRDEACMRAAVENIRTVEFRDEVHRAIFSALAAELEGGDRTSSGALTPAAAKRLAALRNDPEEIPDAERAFADAVAGIKVPWLFLRLEQLDRELNVGTNEERVSALRARTEVTRELQTLGRDPNFSFKASPRHRAMLRDAGFRDTPTEAG